MTEVDEIMVWMEANRNTKNVKGMARFGIVTDDAYGIPLPALRAKAREYRKRHDVALGLWETGMHECRVMASMVADPVRMTSETADRWVAEFDSWDVCDQCCSNLLCRTPFAHRKIRTYAADEREFVRRTAFVLIATLAVHDKKASDADFTACLGLIEEYSEDPRNFVKKAVNWALRQIGKRNLALNDIAAQTAARLASSDNPTARWIGKDALRELTAPKTILYITNHRHLTKV